MSILNRLFKTSQEAEAPRVIPEGTATYGKQYLTLSTVLYVKHIRGSEVLNTRFVFDKSLTKESAVALIRAFVGQGSLGDWLYSQCFSGDYNKIKSIIALPNELLYKSVIEQYTIVNKDKCSSIASFTFDKACTVKEYCIFESEDYDAPLLAYSTFAGLDVQAGDTLTFEFDITANYSI